MNKSQLGISQSYLTLLFKALQSSFFLELPYIHYSAYLTCCQKVGKLLLFPFWLKTIISIFIYSHYRIFQHGGEKFHLNKNTSKVTILDVSLEVLYFCITSLLKKSICCSL